MFFQTGDFMEKKLVEVEVSVGAYDLGQNLGKFIASVRQALADGWQPGSDIPALISAAVEDLVPSVSDIAKLGDESADKQALANALFLGLSPVVFSFVEKKA